MAVQSLARAESPTGWTPIFPERYPVAAEPGLPGGGLPGLALGADVGVAGRASSSSKWFDPHAPADTCSLHKAAMTQDLYFQVRNPSGGTNVYHAQQELRTFFLLGQICKSKNTLLLLFFIDDLMMISINDVFQYIQYKTHLPDLREFTLCMWTKFYNHSNDHPLFSYASKYERFV